MLLPRLDVMDSKYATLYRIVDDLVFHVHVPRTPAAETVGRHLDSSFVIFPDYIVVVDRRRQEVLHLSKETKLIYNFYQHHYVRTMSSKFIVEKTSTTPATAGEKLLSKDDAPKTETETEKMRATPYREVVAVLMWAATTTRSDVADAAHQLGNFDDNLGFSTLEGGEKSTTIPVAHEGYWDRLRRNAVVVVHKTVGMGRLRFRHLPRHSAFGFRRRSDAGGGRDQLVLEGVEGNSGRVIRIRVCGADRRCKRSSLSSTSGFLPPPIDDDIKVREDSEGAITMVINRFSRQAYEGRGRETQHRPRCGRD